MTGPAPLLDEERIIETTRGKRYSAYPAYKPSGVDWLGDIPAHWGIKRLKNFSEIRFSNVDKNTIAGELPVRLCNYVDVYYNEKITRRMTFMKATATQNEIRKFRLKKGDVIVTKDSESWDDIAVPSLVDEDFEGVICGYHLAQIRPLKHHSVGSFLARAFASIGIRDQFRIAASGVTRYGLPKSGLCDSVFPVPPLKEQNEIAWFLDEQTQKIDDLISAKRELLTLLKEKRQAVITHAVTRGLDSNVKFKPSGIDWVGDVPEHWDIISFRRIVSRLEQGWSPVASNYPAEKGDFGVLKLNSVHQGQFCSEKNKALEDIPDNVSFITPEAGDLLISRSNTPRLVGDVCIVKSDFPKLIISDLIYRVSLTERADFRYICWFLLSSSGRSQIEGDARGSSGSMVKLGQNHLRGWQLPLPPKPQQMVIADYLDSETAKFDNLSAEIQKAITTLQEYRTALISAAVTGKIDVCNEVNDGA